MRADLTTHRDYSAASCNFARAQRDAAFRELEAMRERFPVLIAGLQAVDARGSEPLVTEDLAYALDRIGEELGDV